MNIGIVFGTLIVGITAIIASTGQSMAQSAAQSTDRVAPAQETAAPNTNTNPHKHRYWRHRGGQHPHYGSRRVRTHAPQATATAPRGGARAASFAGIDRNANGVIDIEEAMGAARLLFQHLDRNHTGKLSRAEIGRRRLTAAEFNWADRDHDGLLNEDEYLTLVERQFRAADINHDGRVSRAELKSGSGLPLRRLIY